MFETAEIGRKLGKTEYESILPQLRAELLAVQKQAFEAGLPVVVLLNGVDGGGKGDFLNKLFEWMDARYLTTHAYAPLTEEESQRPQFWRFWMGLPSRGRIGAFLGSWYTEPVLQAAYGTLPLSQFEHALEQIVHFERALALDGTLFVKLWFHLSKKEQKRHFIELEKSKFTRWQVSERDWEHHRMYDQFRSVCSRAIRTTSITEAPWNIIEGTDGRYRNVVAARTLIESIRAQATRPEPPTAVANTPQLEDPRTILDTLDMDSKLGSDEYTRKLGVYQGRINRQSRRL